MPPHPTNKQFKLRNHIQINFLQINECAFWLTVHIDLCLTFFFHISLEMSENWEMFIKIDFEESAKCNYLYVTAFLFYIFVTIVKS